MCFWKNHSIFCIVQSTDSSRAHYRTCVMWTELSDTMNKQYMYTLYLLSTVSTHYLQYLHSICTVSTVSTHCIYTWVEGYKGFIDSKTAGVDICICNQYECNTWF